MCLSERYNQPCACKRLGSGNLIVKLAPYYNSDNDNVIFHDNIHCLRSQMNLLMETYNQVDICILWMVLVVDVNEKRFFYLYKLTI